MLKWMEIQALGLVSPLRTNFVIFSIFLLLACPSFGERALSAKKSKKIKQAPIVKSQETQGEEEVWAIESIRRSNAIYPSNFGQAGIFRLRSGEGLPQGSLTFGIGGEFYKISNSPLAGGETETIAESLFVGFSPTRRLTIAIVRRNSSTTFGNPQKLISSLGDFTLSGLYSFPISKSMAIAPLIDLTVASNFNNLAPAGETLSAGFGVAFTYSLFPATGMPLFLHANLIYHSPEMTGSGPATLAPETFFNFSRFHTITLGVGGEIKLGDFIPFVEIHQKNHTSSSVSFGSSPSKFSLGTRFHPLRNKSLSLLLGFDIGMGKGLATGVPFSPDYQIIGQASYTVGISNTERKHYYTTQDVNVVDRKFIIRKKIDFKLDSAELQAASTGLLDQIARVIKQNKIQRLLIAGHTDSTASEDYNARLSKNRANSVKKYLVSKGVSPKTLVTQGLGKRKPRASNLTSRGRAKNRRVEFFILE